MEITRTRLLEGASQARGCAVIVDVFRAFTCASILLHYGVGRLRLEEDPDTVLRLKRDEGYLAIGETGGVPVKGFDLGNSPTEITARGAGFFRGRDVAHRTSAGVRGIFASISRGCEPVYAAAFTTVSALAALIGEEAHGRVELVAMGENGTEPVPEDEHCAALLHHLLDPTSPYDHLAAVREITGHESARKFLRGDRPHFPRIDVTWCLQRDMFDFAMRARNNGGVLELVKAYPGNSNGTPAVNGSPVA